MSDPRYQQLPKNISPLPGHLSMGVTPPSRWEQALIRIKLLLLSKMFPESDITFGYHQYSNKTNIIIRVLNFFIAVDSSKSNNK